MELPESLPRALLLMVLLLPWLAATVNATLIPRESARRWVEWGILALLSALTIAVFACLSASGDADGISLEVAVGRSPSDIPGSGAFLTLWAWNVDIRNVGLLALVPLVAMTAKSRGPRPNAPGRSELPLVGGMVWTICAGDPTTLSIGMFTSIVGLSARLVRHGEPDKRRTTPRFLTVQLLGWGLILASPALLASITAMVRSAPHGLPTSIATTFASLASQLQGAVAGHPAARLLWEQYGAAAALVLGLGAALAAGLYPFQGGLVAPLDSATVSERLWIVLWTRLSLLVPLRLALLLMPDFPHGYSPWLGAVLLTASLATALLMFGESSRPPKPGLPIVWLALQSALLPVIVPFQWTAAIACGWLASTATSCLIVLVFSESSGPAGLVDGRGPSSSNRFRRTYGSVGMAATFVGAPCGLGLTANWLVVYSILTAEVGIWAVPFLFVHGVSHLLALAALLRGIRSLDVPTTPSEGESGEGTRFWTALWLVISLAAAAAVPCLTRISVPA